MRIYQCANEPQTEAESTSRSVRDELFEAVEDAYLIFLRDTDTSIANT